MQSRSAADKAIKTKLLHIGLVLVTLPCLIDIACLWALYDLTARTETLAHDEHRILEIVRCANSVVMLYTITSAKVVNFLIASPGVGRNRQKQEAIASVTKLRQQFDAYAYAAREDPDVSEQVLRIRALTENEINRLIFYSNTNEDASVLQAYSVLGPNLRQLIKDAARDSDMIMEVVDQQQKLLAAKSDEQKQSRMLIKQIVLFGIAANTIFAIAFALIFFRRITNRLKVLVDNAQRLPKMLPLNQKVQGTDELSYLDTVLHDASTELRNALEQRQYLMDMVAHDIRSPLMSSQVSLEILSDPRVGDLPSSVKRQIESLNRNIKRLTALTTDLLTVDKLEAGKLDVHPSELNAREAVQESIDSLYDLAKSRQIILLNECEDVEIFADRIRLGQVLTNLLSNAIKFSPDGADVTVRSSSDPEGVTLLVIDKGQGIALVDQEKVFEKYGQLENGAGKGFGLGLAICKLIVEAHGGSINVKSKPGQGACFWFQLPNRVCHLNDQDHASADAGAADRQIAASASSDG